MSHGDVLIIAKYADVKIAVPPENNSIRFYN